MRFAPLATMLLIVSVTGARFSVSEPADGAIADWPYYGGDAGGSRYSLLTQVDKSNFAQLQVAWEYHTGDVSTTSGERVYHVDSRQSLSLVAIPAKA